MQSTSHNCELPQEILESGALTVSPYATALSKCLNQLKRYTTVYKHFHQSEHYYRSHVSFVKERNRHLGTPRYQYVIHPFSLFAIGKRLTMCVVWITSFFVFSYLGSFEAKPYFKGEKDRDNPLYVTLLVGTLHALLTVDVCIRFLMGYNIEQTREVVLEPKQIVKNYLKTYFFFDTIPTICTNMFLFFWYLEERHQLMVFQLHILRSPRLITLLNNITELLRFFKIREPIRITVLLSIVCVLSLHYMTCLTELIPVVRDYYNISNEHSWFDKLKRERKKLAAARNAYDQESHYGTFHNYLQYMTVVMCHFFGAGRGRFHSMDSVEMAVFNIILLYGICFYLYTIARIVQLFGMVNISETKYEELISQAGEYMTSKKFPSNLRKRINNYYEYKFGKTFFSEEKILESLSEHLRMEILLYSCRHMIGNVQIFRGLSKSAVGSILALLKQEIYMPQDKVMAADDNSGTLYFVLYGTCGVLLISGKEALHIEDGDYFGNPTEVTQSRLDMLYSVVALEPCEIYTLSSRDIRYCCSHYPEIMTKLEWMEKAKTKYYNRVFSLTEMQEDFLSDDILTELRKGNILEHGRKRADFFHAKYFLE